MTNIGNKLMAGFYATPDQVGAQLKQIFQFTNPGAVFDPTCGKGSILNTLCGDYDFIETYGVEIEKGRADEAKQVLNHVINAPIESMRISNESFSFIYLNPPYDYEISDAGKSSERKEVIELERSLKYLAPNGVLCYVVPYHIVAAAAKILATYFSEVQIVRFDNDLFEDYKQCIFIGRKKTASKKSTNSNFMEVFELFKNENFVFEKIKTLSSIVGEVTYDIPGTNPNIKLFTSRIGSKEENIKLIKQHSAFESIKQALAPRVLTLDSQPIINVSQGQMGLLLASGAINGVLEEKDGKNHHIVQGLEIVSKHVTKERLEDESIKTVERTKREVSVKIITSEFVRKLQ